MVKNLVQGFGVNDASYVTEKREELPKVNGKRKSRTVWVCPYYKKWRGIIVRSYDTSRPAYKDCYVCEEWRYLSNFIRWVNSQPDMDWKNKQLDKDILFVGNKVYSPDTCCFVPQNVNKFPTDSAAIRGKYMIGVSPSVSKKNPYLSQCEDPLGVRSTYLGVYPTEIEAHLAWKSKKHGYALELAELENDPRIKEALSIMYK